MSYGACFTRLLTTLKPLYEYLDPSQKKAYDNLATAFADVEALLKRQPPLSCCDIGLVNDGVAVSLRRADHSEFMEKDHACNVAGVALRSVCPIIDRPAYFVQQMTGGTMNYDPTMKWAELAQAIADHLAAKKASAVKLNLPTASSVRTIADQVNERKKEITKQVVQAEKDVVQKLNEAVYEGQYQMPLAFLGERPAEFWQTFTLLYAQLGYTVRDEAGGKCLSWAC